MRSLGATAAINTTVSSMEEEAPDADVFIDCSGAPSAVLDGIRAVRPAGSAVLVGMCPASEIAFPIAVVQNREIRVTGTFRYANTYTDAIALLASGKLDLEGLVDVRFSLESSEDAFDRGAPEPVNPETCRSSRRNLTGLAGSAPRCWTRPGRHANRLSRARER